MTNPRSLPEEIGKETPWKNLYNPIWQATTFVLKRNIDKQYFPHQLSIEQKVRLNTLIREALFNVTPFASSHYLPYSSMQPTEKELLQERFLLFEPLQHAEEGEGIVLDKTRNNMALINTTDHLQLHSMTTNFALQDTWKDLLSTENALTKFLNFAFDPRFGYLTSNPADAGTALTIRAFIHAPALLQGNQLPQLLEHMPEDVYMYGLGPEKSFIGDLLVMENRYKIGLNEETILHILHQSAWNVVAQEQEKRMALRDKASLELLDKVARAHGLLQNTRQLRTQEALQSSSLVQLGKHLGWIDGIGEDFFARAFFIARRGHLLFRHPDLPTEQIGEQRAKVFRDLYRDAKLTV